MPAEVWLLLVGDDREDEELDEFVLTVERVSCVGVCFGVAWCDSDERAAFVPQA